MSVNFTGENNQPISYKSAKDERGIIAWLIRKGVVKNKTQANGVLILIIIVCVGIIWYSSGGMESKPTPNSEMLPSDFPEGFIPTE